jgi:hypothetical protein
MAVYLEPDLILNNYSESEWGDSHKFPDHSGSRSSSGSTTLFFVREYLELFSHLFFFVGSEGKNENYGAQRVWGSIGWGAFTVLAGYMVDTYSHGLPHGHKVTHS